MTAITAAQVKELREITGAGMMECKKALVEANGSKKDAIEALRVKGQAKADKRAGKVASQGTIVLLTNGDSSRALVCEVNCETDFVGRDENFLAFAKAAAQTAWDTNTTDATALLSQTMSGASETVEEGRQALIGKVGENVLVRRLAAHEVKEPSTLGVYRHNDRIGVIVVLDVDNKELAKDLAMHIAASRPLVTTPEEVSADLIEKEKEIYAQQAANSGKPKDIVEKMVAGKLRNFLNEVSLVGQPFVKNPDLTVGEILTKARAKVVAFTRFEVGEGIEVEKEDFAEAVLAMTQAQGS